MAQQSQIVMSHNIYFTTYFSKNGSAQPFFEPWECWQIQYHGGFFGDFRGTGFWRRSRGNCSRTDEKVATLDVTVVRVV
jgi:hypothetical protein